MKKIIALLLVSLLTIGLFTGCGSKQGSNGADKNATAGDSTPKKGGTIIVGLGADPMSFNPDSKGDDNAFPINQNIFNRLMKINNNQQIVPDLAKSYDVSEDGTQITFHLNENVKWHDGTPFSSEDVKFTYDTIIKEKGQIAGSLSSIKEITCSDNNTVVFHLSQNDSALLGYLSWYGCFIMPKHIYEGTDWNTNAANLKPIGTGPFKFVEHKKGVSVTIERNDDYWGDVPYLDKIVYSIIPDTNTATQSLYNGELDILGVNPPFSESERFMTDPKLKAGKQHWPTRFHIAFNVKDGIFANPKLRQAVAYGIDKDKIINKALKGMGLKATTAMTPLYKWALNTTDVYPERDIEKAKKLIEEAGYKANANGIYLTVNLDMFNSDPFPDVATVVKDNLKEIGIDVKINLMEGAAWDQKVWESKNYEFTILGGYQGPDPGGLYGRFASDGSMNIMKYSNKKLDEVLKNGAIKVSQEERAPFYNEAQKIIVQDMPMVPISEWISVLPYQSYIMGHPTSPEAIDKTGFDEYTYVWINK